ncbi:Crp/Fnr family transcriptional regulator [Sphingomonas sp. MMS24-J13]|uniref:Crp/Fnr family transcriptional regulator n=1 Tax=Sphingomonas sp. MMS24-J13 TaxID=3238686 RepID=UPI00384EE73B
MRDVSGSSRDELERCAVLRRFAIGESLFSQGDAPREIFVIDSGRVKVWRATEEGVAITLTLIGPGALLGTLGATQNHPHNATATAVTAVEAVAWGIADMRRIMADDPALAAAILRTVTKYAEQLVERLEELSAVPIEQRLARTLLRQADQSTEGEDLPLSRQDLADLTSSTLPTVSRIMSKWRRARLIAGTRGKVRILDALRLADVGEIAG